MARNFDDRHLWWIGTAGRLQIVDDDFVAGAQSPLLAMSRDGGFLDFRDQGFEELQTSAPIKLNMSRIFGVRGDADVDPAAPLDIVLTITRAKGQMLPTYTTQKAKLTYAPPTDLFSYPSKAAPEWQSAWKDMGASLGLIATALLLLTVVLASPRRIVAYPARLQAFRLSFLAFTLFYLGWWAQGQLSIVQITGALKALTAGLGLSSYLYDPVSLVLISFTFVTFVLWGRGVFCGWLCPFGALQEFIGLLTEKLKIPQLSIPARIARPLERTRFLVLAVLAAAAVFAPHLGESLNEVEPFKTTFTHSFHRSAPFIAYVAALLLIGAFYFKFFCRFLCPLGAAMSLGGGLRQLNWLARRKECGAPCQLCKVACKYDAIEQDGRIRYDACFQCLDCVSLYHDENRCVPLVLLKKNGRVIAPKGKVPQRCNSV
jgi:polyferredoxin